MDCPLQKFAKHSESRSSTLMSSSSVLQFCFSGLCHMTLAMLISRTLQPIQLMTFKSGRVKTVHHSVHHMHLLFHIIWQDCGNQQLYCAMAVCIFLYTCMLSGLVRELPRKSNSHQKLWRLDKDLVWQMWCCSQQVTLVEIYQNALFLYINLGFRV